MGAFWEFVDFGGGAAGIVDEASVGAIWLKTGKVSSDGLFGC